jgi:cobaltochelatase CobT
VNEDLRYWRTRLPLDFSALAEALTGRLDDQRAYAEAVYQLIATFGLDVTRADPGADTQDDPGIAGSGEQKSQKEDIFSTAREARELIRASPQDSPAGPEDSDAAGAGDINADLLPEGGGEDPGGRLKRPRGAGVIRPILADYRVFTTEFDRVARPDHLCPPADLTRLRRAIDRRLNEVQASVGRYAARLSRSLLAKAERGWDVDLDEGHLDSRQLARVVENPASPLAFKRPKDISFRDTVVTLLIDNSGSMRGEPIEVAAVSADVLGGTLERCGVAFEILGFTTAAWKGGRCLAHWRGAGEPANPGRINEVQHIVYKSANEPWRRARRHLGLMLADNLLKENVDGEALLWAHGRLLARPERRRILIVLSDGEPVDNATLDLNPDDYLERHLIAAIDHIERCSSVELLAIGIGHDVGRYYPHSVTIESPSDLTLELLAQIAARLEAGLPDPHDAERRPPVGLFGLDDFARLPVIRGDGARFGPIPGERIAGVATHH